MGDLKVKGVMFWNWTSLPAAFDNLALCCSRVQVSRVKVSYRPPALTSYFSLTTTTQADGFPWWLQVDSILALMSWPRSRIALRTPPNIGEATPRTARLSLQIRLPSRRNRLGPLARLEGINRYLNICHLLILPHATNMNFDTSTPNAAIILRKTLSSCQR